MSYIEKLGESRVIVTPRSIGNYGWAFISDYGVEPDEQKRMKLYREACEEIAAQIKRDVDGLQRNSVCVETETMRVCEHCGAPWTEALTSLHNGGCCDLDAANMGVAAIQKAEK